MTQKRSSGVWALLLVLFFGFAILGGIWFAYRQVSRTVDNTLDPLKQTNRELSTQVANLLHPTPTVLADPVTIIKQVQDLARLETVRYTVEKVITAQIDHGILDPLLGDKLLFVAHGYVIGGIDMSKMTAQDLALKDNVLYVHLPAAEVLVVNLDNEQSYVYIRDTGLLAKPDPNLETQARQLAEAEIRKAALNDGILDMAGANAQTYLRWFFESLGYKQVDFTTTAP
jgi:hypothetical protein